MRKTFFKQVLAIAVPVALQSLIQSSFSVVDQVMIGQLGEASIAAIGFAGKFLSLALTVIAGTATAAGILAAQYEGRNDRKSLESSFFQVLVLAMITAALFLLPAVLAPGSVMGLYSTDAEVVRQASGYLRLFAWSLPFSVLTSLYSVILRCCGSPRTPLYASVAGILANTLLNALFIFGLGLGVQGAALASLLAQIVMAGLTLLFVRRDLAWFHLVPAFGAMKTVFLVLVPLVLTEFLWSLGENIYTMVYGHLGTSASAAMTMTIPLQTMLIGILSGLSQAAGILIGQQLGKGDQEGAWRDSLSLIRYSLTGSVILAGILILLAPLYVRLYSVSEQVRSLCIGLIIEFAFLSIVKVQNIVVAGGIIRSGGRTSLVLGIDLLGTWGVGVPLALWSGGQHLSILWVYLLLSSEEVLRLVISYGVFASRIWMKQIDSEKVPEPETA